jgi:hypothetical protein
MDETIVRAMEDVARAHGQCDRDDIAWLRSLTPSQRSALLESACAAAAAIRRSRLEAGLADVEPAPWPESTWEFLRKHAARARGETTG